MKDSHARPPPEPPAGPGKVLVAAETESLRAVLSALVQELGLEVRQAQNLEAWELIRTGQVDGALLEEASQEQAQQQDTPGKAEAFRPIRVILVKGFGSMREALSGPPSRKEPDWIGLKSEVARQLAGYGQLGSEARAEEAGLVPTPRPQPLTPAELELRLQHSQKMEAVGRLASGIAHDYNNLITVILGYTDVALADMPANDPSRSFLEEIKKASERAGALTHQLLRFTRRRPSAPVVLSLNRVVAEMEKLLRRVIGEDVELVTQLAAAGCTLMDQAQLEQVIINLVVNARDAMPRGGRLVLQTGRAAHPALPPGSYALLAVTDTGTGMDEATRARLFEPFFTTKEEGKGTGLGLTIVQNVVRSAGGHIHVESTPGRGSTFQIYLPRLEEPPPAVQAETALAAAPRGTETVLLVEDDRALCTLAAHVLRLQGYRVITAPDGLAGWLVGTECKEHIDLLITDLVMPFLGGHHLVNRLLPERPDMKVLYLSGHTDPRLGSSPLVESPTPEEERIPPPLVLHKPFTPDALARKVREVLDG